MISNGQIIDHGYFHDRCMNKREYEDDTMRQYYEKGNVFSYHMQI